MRNEHFQVLICICNGKIENFHLLSSAISQSVNSLASIVGGDVAVVVSSLSCVDLTNYHETHVNEGCDVTRDKILKLIFLMEHRQNIIGNCVYE